MYLSITWCCKEVGSTTIKKNSRKNKSLSVLQYDMNHTENDASNNSSIAVHVFVATGLFLLTCCIATEPLPSNNRRIQIHACRQQHDLISLILFLQNGHCRLNKVSDSLVTDTAFRNYIG
jgi:hypothetical protein